MKIEQACVERIKKLQEENAGFSQDIDNLLKRLEQSKTNRPIAPPRPVTRHTPELSSPTRTPPLLASSTPASSTDGKNNNNNKFSHRSEISSGGTFEESPERGLRGQHLDAYRERVTSSVLQRGLPNPSSSPNNAVPPPRGGYPNPNNTQTSSCVSHQQRSGSGHGMNDGRGRGRGHGIGSDMASASHTNDATIREPRREREGLHSPSRGGRKERILPPTASSGGGIDLSVPSIDRESTSEHGSVHQEHPCQQQEKERDRHAERRDDWRFIPRIPPRRGDDPERRSGETTGEPHPGKRCSFERTGSGTTGTGHTSSFSQTQSKNWSSCSGSSTFAQSRMFGHKWIGDHGGPSERNCAPPPSRGKETRSELDSRIPQTPQTPHTPPLDGYDQYSLGRPGNNNTVSDDDFGRRTDDSYRENNERRNDGPRTNPTSSTSPPPYTDFCPPGRGRNDGLAHGGHHDKVRSTPMRYREYDSLYEKNHHSKEGPHHSPSSQNNGTPFILSPHGDDRARGGTGPHDAPPDVDRHHETRPIEETHHRLRLGEGKNLRHVEASSPGSPLRKKMDDAVDRRGIGRTTSGEQGKTAESRGMFDRHATGVVRAKEERSTVPPSRGAGCDHEFSHLRQSSPPPTSDAAVSREDAACREQRREKDRLSDAPKKTSFSSDSIESEKMMQDGSPSRADESRVKWGHQRKDQRPKGYEHDVWTPKYSGRYDDGDQVSPGPTSSSLRPGFTDGGAHSSTPGGLYFSSMHQPDDVRGHEKTEEERRKIERDVQTDDDNFAAARHQSAHAHVEEERRTPLRVGGGDDVDESPPPCEGRRDRSHKPMHSSDPGGAVHSSHDRRSMDAQVTSNDVGKEDENNNMWSHGGILKSPSSSSRECAQAQDRRPSPSSSSRECAQAQDRRPSPYPENVPSNDKKAGKDGLYGPSYRSPPEDNDVCLSHNTQKAHHSSTVVPNPRYEHTIHTIHTNSSPSHRTGGIHYEHMKRNANANAESYESRRPSSEFTGTSSEKYKSHKMSSSPPPFGDTHKSGFSLRLSPSRLRQGGDNNQETSFRDAPPTPTRGKGDPGVVHGEDHRPHGVNEPRGYEYEEHTHNNKNDNSNNNKNDSKGGPVREMFASLRSSPSNERTDKATGIHYGMGGYNTTQHTIHGMGKPETFTMGLSRIQSMAHLGRPSHPSRHNINASLGSSSSGEKRNKKPSSAAPGNQDCGVINTHGGDNMNNNRRGRINGGEGGGTASSASHATGSCTRPGMGITSEKHRESSDLSLADGFRQIHDDEANNRWKNFSTMTSSSGAFGFQSSKQQEGVNEVGESGLSVILDRRIEDVNERFNQYTQVLQKLKDANPNDDAHQRALRDIIERRATFYKEYSLPSSHRSGGTLSSRRQIQDWIPKPTDIVPVLQLPTLPADDKSEIRNPSSEKRDDLLSDLRWRLRKKEEELGNSNTMLTNTQRALEHLFHENIEMAEELMTVFKDTTSFLDELEEENRNLKEELRDRTEKANAALLEIAQKNCELTSKLEVAQKDRQHQQIFTVSKDPGSIHASLKARREASLQARREREGRKGAPSMARSTSVPPGQLFDNHHRVERVPRRINENNTSNNIPGTGLRSRYATVSANLRKLQRKALVAAS